MIHIYQKSEKSPKGTLTQKCKKAGQRFTEKSLLIYTRRKKIQNRLDPY